MHPWKSSANNVGWQELWKILQPQARCFRFPMTEHKRLYDLCLFYANNLFGMT
jgi:hypothetical protein